MPQVSSSVTTNYNRIQTPFSRFGTRRLQAYTIFLYGVSDQDAVYLDPQSIPVFDTWEEYIAWVESTLGLGLLTEDTSHYGLQWPSNSLPSDIILGAQDVAEVFWIGQFNLEHNDTDDNDLSVTIMVADENFLNGESMDFDSRSRSMIDAIYNRIQGYDWQDINVYRTLCTGYEFLPEWDPRDNGGDGPNALAHLASRTTPTPNRVSKASLKRK